MSAVLPDVRAVYRAPSGRLCRLQPPDNDKGRLSYWSFGYLDGDGRMLITAGFTLSHSNLRLLQEVRHGTAAR